MGRLTDIVEAIAPPWLKVGAPRTDVSQAPVGGRLLYSMAIVMDAQIEKLVEGVKAALPTKTLTESSLAYIGQDLLIGRGLSETALQYGKRLQRALDDWFFAGAPRSILAQVLGYVAAASPRVLTVSNNSAWDYLPAGSALGARPTHLPSAAAVAPTANWDWDSVSLAPYSSTLWFRFWVIVDATGWVTSTRKCGDGVAKCGDPRYSCGFDAPSSVFTGLVALIKLWKSEHAVAFPIVCIDSSEFIPTDAPGSGSLPDGKWGPWDKLVTSGGKISRQPSRSSKARYLGVYP